MKHKISTLPKWAQKIIDTQSRENDRLAIEISNLKKVTRQLDEGRGKWFTLFHPGLSNRKGVTILFILQHNHAQSICSLGENDFIMVCRAERQVGE